MLQSARSFLQEKEINDWKSWFPKRGEIFSCDLGFNMDCIQSGIRPVLVIQNNVGNTHSSSTVIIPISSKRKFSPKIHIHIEKEFGLKECSYALAEQVTTITKRRFFHNGFPWKICKLPEFKMLEIQYALEFELGFEPLMFDEDKVFKMIEHIKILENNIKTKQSKDLINILNQKVDDFFMYCKKYNKNHKIIFNEYNKIQNYTCEAI